MNATWTKIRALGSGRATTVWEGHDEALDRPVAIKELHAPLASRKGFVEAYLEEARRMAAVSHPRLLTIHAVDGSTDPPRLIVELADGTVRDLAAAGRLQPERAETLLSHALEGLSALHSRGLLHRAIRPENLFYRGGGFKLGDFGIGATSGSPTLLLSSPRYMAPEALSAHADEGGPGSETILDARSDLYSLGLVLYELLLGTRRFEEVVRNRVADLPRPSEAGRAAPTGELELWLRFHRDGTDLPEPRELAPNVPERLSKVVARLARKNPAERYPDAEAARRALLDGSGGEGRRSPEDPTVHVASRGSGRESGRGRRWRTWAALAALLSLAGVAGTFLLVTRDRLRVDIRSDPSGAEVLSFDGEDRIAQTPVDGLLVSVGGRLLVRKEGFHDAELRFDDRSRSLYRVVLEPEPKERRLDSPAALVEELVALAGPRNGPRLTPGGDHGTSLRLLDPIRLRVETSHEGGMVLFAISPDGSVHRVYPGPGEDRFPVGAGDRFLVPTAEHVAAGFHLIATAPAGRETIFLLTLRNPSAIPPQGRPTSDGWLVSYPFTGPSSPAADFVRWVADQRRRSPAETGLAFLELDIRPAAGGIP